MPAAWQPHAMPAMRSIPVVASSSDPRMTGAFATLVAIQALHSLEEFRFRLFDALAPARWVSDLIGIDRAAGFACVNLGLLLFGLWCWLGPVRRGRGAGRTLAAGWGIVELANGVTHLALAAAARGYFPGAYTAPLLLLAAARLLVLMRRDRASASPN